jgi:solute carrier family 35 protein F1/2
MSHIQPDPQPSTDFYGKSNDAGIVESVDKTGAGIAVSPENEHNGASLTNNPVLEQVAQEKGRWFQYVKTKQFWITLLLGQGMSFTP